ncbi:MAG: AAA family ATPase, partial [Myxococcota bacterium]
QTDIYAWGLVFLECLTGQRVVRGSTIAETMFSHLRPEPHPLPPMVAAHPLGRVMRSSLAKDAASRYADARDVLAQLKPCDVNTLRRMPRVITPIDPDDDTAAAIPTADPYADDAIEIISATGRPLRISESDLAATRDAVERSRSQGGGSTSSSQKLVAERRQLTAMICELGPIAVLSENLDPEELYAVMARFRRVVETLVSRLEGVVERVEGARVVCYFGYPAAHEDDASRAVQAAVEIIQQVRDGAITISDSEFPGDPEVSLGVQAGLHAGLVVTSNIHLAKTGEVSIVGDVARLAVRLQESADFGTILITEQVHRLVHDRFECIPEGTRLLGNYGSVAVYRALGLADATSINSVTEERPSIGRSAEVNTLIDLWDEAGESRGQVVLLTGEAGIGKSHLTAVFRRRIREDSHFWLEFAASPYMRGRALHPAMHALRVLLSFERDDSDAIRRRKVSGFLTRHNLDRGRFETFLCALLEILDESVGDGVAAAMRQPFEEQLIDFLFALTDIRPVVVCIEDLHWADPSTQEFAHALVDQVPLSSVFALITTRPSYLPDWRNRSHVIRMALSRLSRRRVETMIRAVAGHKRMPDELVLHLAQRTDGVPLFVEEFTKAVLESDAVVEHKDHYELAGDLSSLAIPATLRGSLMARLDRLGAAKEVAQIAAIIGREFTFGLIESICDMPDYELTRSLNQLINAELIIQRGRPPSAKYIFKHALVQDTAYESLLDKTRRRYHARIADSLETEFTEYAQANPEILAHHYTEARQYDKAVRYWLRAGTRASERSASRESIQHLRKGLELLTGLKEELARNKLELTLLMALGPPLMAIHGYGSPEIEHNYSRARDLCGELHDDRDLLPALWGLWVYYQVQARYVEALESGEQLFRLAQGLDDPELYLSAHQAVGASLAITGQYARARDHFEQGLSIYDPDKHRHMALIYGQDPGMYCHIFMAWVLFAQGHLDRAVQSADAAIALARSVEHPSSLAFALCMSLRVFQGRGDVARVREITAEATELAAEYGFMHWLPFARFMRAWAQAKAADIAAAAGEPSTDRDEAIAEMYEALADWRARASSALPYFHSLLADHLGRAGKVAEAVAVQSQVPAGGPDHTAVYYEGIWTCTRAKLLVLRDEPGDRDEAADLLIELISSCGERGDRVSELTALAALINLEHGRGRPIDDPRTRLTELHAAIVGELEDSDAPIPFLDHAARVLEECR